MQVEELALGGQLDTSCVTGGKGEGMDAGENKTEISLSADSVEVPI